MAAVIFVCACITDYFDGYFARAWDQASHLGRLLDPIADKLLVASTLLSLVSLDRIEGLTLIPALVILCREIFVSGLREFLAELRKVLPVSYLAKWKTVMQMTALTFLLTGDTQVFQVHLHQVGILLLWVAAILTVVTGMEYLKTGLRHIDSK